MALVMKQLNQSNEAIEAIKCFQHMRPSDSHETLDSILVELKIFYMHLILMMRLHYRGQMRASGDPCLLAFIGADSTVVVGDYCDHTGP
ncbi:hypothetical protein P8452_42687 [Trifolium repens]|nr:hypothetical protein P8452_42687 [Trifolium repens]